ncbi:GntR family transcriptional regulator [Lactobacillus apis]|uniref:GntR family transcriptional regulator n=1 Tax=Lactobacillus apis TaxID=303541 RepID=UPI00242D81DB|nr:GntR family transcriptional regulator [Lactobacillus apis]
MSKYQDIVLKLVEKLDNGWLNPGDRFYSEAEISRIYHVSSTTAVKVLNTLEQQNKVTRVQGSGTFVAKEAHKQVAMLTDLNLAEGQTESVKVLLVRMGDDQDVLQKLHSDEINNYLEVRRLRYIGKKVSQYSISYLNPNYLNTDELDNLPLFSSVYQKVRDDSKIDPFELPFKQKNCAKTVSDKEILQYFTQEARQLFIYQERETYLPLVSGELLEYAISYKLPEYWGYEAAATAYRQ